MVRKKDFANRLNEVLFNGRWIANTNYKQQLENTSWQQATKKIGNLNTIAALVYHVNYYIAGLIKVFNGGKLEIKDKYSFNCPLIKSEADWKKLSDEFIVNSEKIIKAVSKFPDSQFDKTFVHEKYGSYERNIEEIIEHSYYHLGQITLIKKMMNEDNL